MIDKLREFSEILGKCEQGEDFTLELANLLDGAIEGSIDKLSVQKVMDISDKLEFKILITKLNETDIREVNISDYINSNQINIEEDFFDFVKKIVKDCGIVRIEEPQAQINPYVGKQTSFSYVPISKL